MALPIPPASLADVVCSLVYPIVPSTIINRGGKIIFTIAVKKNSFGNTAITEVFNYIQAVYMQTNIDGNYYQSTPRRIEGPIQLTCAVNEYEQQYYCPPPFQEVQAILDAGAGNIGFAFFWFTGLYYGEWFIRFSDNPVFNQLIINGVSVKFILPGTLANVYTGAQVQAMLINYINNEPAFNGFITAAPLDYDPPPDLVDYVDLPPGGIHGMLIYFDFAATGFDCDTFIGVNVFDDKDDNMGTGGGVYPFEVLADPENINCGPVCPPSVIYDASEIQCYFLCEIN